MNNIPGVTVGDLKAPFYICLNRFSEGQGKIDVSLERDGKKIAARSPLPLLRITQLIQGVDKILQGISKDRSRLPSFFSQVFCRPPLSPSPLSQDARINPQPPG